MKEVMIAILIFSMIAVILVMWAGRKDVACDPRLTLFMLGLLGVFPLLMIFLPKMEVLPALNQSEASAGKSMLINVILVGWAVGFILSVIRILLAAVGIAAWRRRSALVGYSGGVELRSLARLRGPVAAGVFRQVIFVPDNWDSLAIEKRKMIVAHELAHHRRYDPLLRLLVEFVKAMHWYHPGVRWMARRYVLQSEFACDEQVLRQGISAQSYVNVLCDFAQGTDSSPLAFAMAEVSSLEQRVKRLVRQPKRTANLALVAIAFTGLAGAVTLCALGRKKSVLMEDEVSLRWSANAFPGEP